MQICRVHCLVLSSALGVKLAVECTMPDDFDNTWERNAPDEYKVKYKNLKNKYLSDEFKRDSVSSPFQWLCCLPTDKR